METFFLAVLVVIMIRDHIAVEYHGQSKEEIQEQHIKNREFLDI